MEPGVTCPQCRFFVEGIQGIRGPYWQGREQAGRRRSYRIREGDGGTYRDRDGTVTVTRDFYPALHRLCGWWLDHIGDESDPSEHVGELLGWVADLPGLVDFRRALTRDTAAHIAAAVLGIDVRSYYRGLAQS